MVALFVSRVEYVSDVWFDCSCVVADCLLFVFVFVLCLYFIILYIVFDGCPLCCLIALVLWLSCCLLLCVLCMCFLFFVPCVQYVSALLCDCSCFVVGGWFVLVCALCLCFFASSVQDVSDVLLFCSCLVVGVSQFDVECALCLCFVCSHLVFHLYVRCFCIALGLLLVY